MPSISAIFFDLDGTLVDSSLGIHNAFTHTFKELGVPSPDAKTIRGFMGPPLESSFATCLPKEQISEAVQIYRSYYKKKGIHEAQLFPQITELLQELSQNYPLYITTTKNTPTAHDMTKNLGIHHFFDGIYGSSPETPHKADVIRYALQTHQDVYKRQPLIPTTTRVLELSLMVSLPSIRLFTIEGRVCFND